jgi:hypothetical protein
MPSREALMRISPSSFSVLGLYCGGHPAEVAGRDVGPRRTVELVIGGAEQVDGLARVLPTARGGAGDVVEDAEHTDDRGRVDGHPAGLVVQGDIASGDGDAHVLAGLGQRLDGLGELPHDLRVLRGPEVQAVGDRHRGMAPGGGDVAVGLGQGQLGTARRIEVAVAAVGVGGDSHAEAGLLVDADDTGIIRVRQRCCPGRTYRTAR